MKDNMSPQISIIIPVYNVEKYLRQCLDSIIRQNYTDWECWIVDDGSTDTSKDICDEYAIKDSRFKVVHKKNGGLSSARQCGMNHCSAPFIAMIDSDDWVDANYLSSMMDAVQDSEVDIVMCDYYTNNGNEQSCVKNGPTDTLPKTVQIETLGGKIHAGLWCKLFKHSLFDDNNIKWPKYSYYEDMFIFISLLQFAKKIAYVPKATYHYRYNPQSYTNDSDFYRRLQMYREFFMNMDSLNKMYHLNSSHKVAEAFDTCINFGKRHLILRYYNRSKEIKPLLEFFPQSMRFCYCRNLGDFIYLLGSRFGFFLPYIIRGWFQNYRKR